MGQILAQPITDKHSDSGGNEFYIYGLSSMQGWRNTMEDAHVVKLDYNSQKNQAFFGVFDGHGGDKVAHYAGENLHTVLKEQEEFAKGNYKEAFTKSYLKIDENILEDPELKYDSSGTTAVSCLLQPSRIVCANAGDSRCIYSSRGKAIPLSFDHKPTLAEERSRIEAAGGFVEMGRVNGNLALSRALGDFEFKKDRSLPPESQAVTAKPDIIEVKDTSEVEFIVIACDGIWDCMSNQDVVDFVIKRIAMEMPLATICEEIMDWCLAPDAFLGVSGSDNMTIIIIGFLNGKSKQDWIKHCAQYAPPPSAPAQEEPETDAVVED